MFGGWGEPTVSKKTLFISKKNRAVFFNITPLNHYLYSK